MVERREARRGRGSPRLALIALAAALLLWRGGAEGAAAGGDLAFFLWGGPSEPKSPLGRKEKELLRSRLEGLEGEARLILFSEKKGCGRCGEAEALLREIVSFSPALSLDVRSLSGDAGLAGSLGVDKVPATVVLGKSDTGIRYYGLPLGYELEAFAGALVQAAAGRPVLSPATLTGLASVGRPVTVTVFVAET